MEPADSKDAVRDQSSRIHYYGESLAYSADGKSLIIAVEKRVKETTETAIGLYDADTGKSLRTIPTSWNFQQLLRTFSMFPSAFSSRSTVSAKIDEHLYCQ